MATQIPLKFEFSASQSFNNFFIGDNQEIVDHLQNCVIGTGENLVYIWGESGFGKSHLLRACHLLAKECDYSSGFLNLKTMERLDLSIFKPLENHEIVCIDNIDTIAGNRDLEHAFFSFFNQLRDNNHRLILSSRHPPNALPVLLPDLKTRLTWGLVLKLPPLSEHHRIAALSYKAHQSGIDITPQVGQFLLNHYNRDLSSLWDLLDKIDHETLAAKRRLTIPFLKQILDQ